MTDDHRLGASDPNLNRTKHTPGLAEKYATGSASDSLKVTPPAAVTGTGVPVT